MANEIATPSATPTPTTPSSQSHAHKKSGKDVHVAVEKASEASESATEASEKAQQASKEARQAADAASRAEQQGGAASSKSIVSLEASPLPFSGGTPAAAVTIAAIPGSTPAARPTLGLEGAPTPSASPPDATTAAEPSLTEAEKLIGDVDKIEKRIDRKNLNADETRRDILAQRLLIGAKKALAERDNVAAISLATKASTLLAPLPKLPTSATSTMR